MRVPGRVARTIPGDVSRVSGVAGVAISDSCSARQREPCMRDLGRAKRRLGHCLGGCGRAKPVQQFWLREPPEGDPFLDLFFVERRFRQLTPPRSIRRPKCLSGSVSRSCVHYDPLPSSVQQFGHETGHLPHTCRKAPTKGHGSAGPLPPANPFLRRRFPLVNLAGWLTRFAPARLCR